MRLLAADTPWLVIIVWVVAVLIARLAKQQKTPAPGIPLAPPDPEGGARADMGGALQRAMEKLRQVEREAQQGQAGPDPARRAAQEQLTRAYLEKQRRATEQKARFASPARPAPMPARVAARPPVRTSVRLVLEDDSALSQESEPEVVDYDDAAAGIAESRQREAEAFERGDTPASPRAAPFAANSSSHPPARPAASLARYADGSLRGAMIVTEILGRPISER